MRSTGHDLSAHELTPSLQDSRRQLAEVRRQRDDAVAQVQAVPDHAAADASPHLREQDQQQVRARSRGCALIATGGPRGGSRHPAWHYKRRSTCGPGILVVGLFCSK